MEGYINATYGERFADVYDDWYGDDGSLALSQVGTPTDVADHLGELFGTGGAILELGVGTGRLALAMADRGLLVTGLDVSPAMLDKLRSKPGADRIVLVEGDMADPASTVEQPVDGFDAVVIGFNTFFNLTTPSDQASCLRGVAKLLRPGGILVLEAFVPDPDAHDPGGQGTFAVRAIDLDRVLLDVVKIDSETQTLVGQRIEMTSTSTRLFPYVLRYATPDQLDALATEAGLTLVGRWEDWHQTPFTDSSSSHVSTWCRPAT